MDDQAQSYLDTTSDSSLEPGQEHRIMVPTTRETSHTRHKSPHDCSAPVSSISSRFWSLQYTPPSSFNVGARKKNLRATYIRLRLRLALSMYGLPIALSAELNFQSDQRSFSIRPALKAEWIVNYTSPGFETICRLQMGLITLSEAGKAFKDLHRSYGGSLDQRDPAGHTYIHVRKNVPTFDLMSLTIIDTIELSFALWDA